MKHNVEAFKKYYINATKEEVIEDMFLDNCNLQKEIERLNNIIKEVRERIMLKQLRLVNEETYNILHSDLNELLEILDKAGDKE